MPDLGSIGTRADLRVRLGATLPPQLVTLHYTSGAPVRVENTEVHTRLYARETDTTPLNLPGFTVEELTPGPAPLNQARFLVMLSRDRILALNAQALAVRPSAMSRTPAGGLRQLHYTLFFEDPGAAQRALFYGRLNIYQGASGA